MSLACIFVEMVLLPVAAFTLSKSSLYECANVKFFKFWASAFFFSAVNCAVNFLSSTPYLIKFLELAYIDFICLSTLL